MVSLNTRRLLVGYRDPQKRLEYDREAKRAKRAAQNVAALQGKLPQGGKGQSKGPLAKVVSVAPVTVPALTDEEFRAQMERLSLESWVSTKVELGVSWINESRRILPYNPKDALALGRAAIALINANLAMLKPPTEGPRQQSMRVQDAAFLTDPEFRAAAKHLILVRQRIISERQQHT